VAPKLSLRQKQLQSRLKEVEDNFIRSFGVRQSNKNLDATFKKNVSLLKELRTKARKMDVPFRGDQELISASDDYRQDRLIRGQEAGYGSGGIDKKTGERKFASNIDREGDTYSFDLVESIKQGKPVGNIYGRKTILNNPIMDAFDVFSILAGVGLGVQAAKAVIKNPSLILKYPKSVQNKVQSVFSNSKGNKQMSTAAVKQGAKTVKPWVKKVLFKTQSGMRKKLQASIDAGKSAADVKLLKSILKQDGSIDQTKLGKLSSVKQSKVQALVGSGGSGKGANIAVTGLVAGSGGALGLSQADLDFEGFNKKISDTLKSPIKKKREREQFESSKFDPGERQKKIDAEKTKTAKADKLKQTQSGGSPDEQTTPSKTQTENKNKKKVVKKSTTPPASASVPKVERKPAPPAPKVSQAEKDKGKDELSVAKQKREKERNRNIDTLDVKDAKDKREKLRASQKLATQEKQSTETTTKKKKEEPKKKGRFAQGKRTIDTGFGKLTIDSTDEAMRNPEDDLNLRKGGMPRGKAFGKGGMYKGSKKAYGMKYGGFTRRGMGK